MFPFALCFRVHDLRFTLNRFPYCGVHIQAYNLCVTTCSIKSLLAVSIVIVLLAGCGLFSRTVKPGEEFVMKPNDKVIVSGTGLEIKVETIGHQTASNAQSQPVSAFFVRMTVASGGQSRSMEVDDSVDVGDYTIKVKSANPFATGGGPNCSLLVTRR
jgi:hypothetical protein